MKHRKLHFIDADLMKKKSHLSLFGLSGNQATINVKQLLMACCLKCELERSSVNVFIVISTSEATSHEVHFFAQCKSSEILSRFRVNSW